MTNCRRCGMQPLVPGCVCSEGGCKCRDYCDDCAREVLLQEGARLYERAVAKPSRVRGKSSKRVGPTESEILAAIRKRLGREADFKGWRLSYGITKDDPDKRKSGEAEKKWKGGLSVRGGSDIIGILCGKLPVSIDFANKSAEFRPFGRFIALEVKTPEHLARIMSTIQRGAIAKLSKTDQRQIMFLAVVRSMGGFGAFVDSEESAVAALDRARRGESE